MKRPGVTGQAAWEASTQLLRSKPNIPLKFMMIPLLEFEAQTCFANAAG
ncbi:hypothetical protein HPF_07135 [Hydrogenophaga pseudoflava]|uniref:Uncharacterized protein n=1 Tax=Hydrogenophaga pseudoflava TaxID=47421 RepID=A0A4P6X1A1_HYDPS|nr:hypothetical protein HPF_07135 [Hydrogenophaga pseudoflava]